MTSNSDFVKLHRKIMKAKYETISQISVSNIMKYLFILIKYVWIIYEGGH